MPNFCGPGLGAAVAATAVGAVGSIASSAIQAGAAGDAANAQADAAAKGAALQQQQYNQTRQDLGPWRNTGVQGLDALRNYLGIQGPSTSPYAGPPMSLSEWLQSPQAPYSPGDAGGWDRQLVANAGWSLTGQGITEGFRNTKQLEYDQYVQNFNAQKAKEQAASQSSSSTNKDFGGYFSTYDIKAPTYTPYSVAQPKYTQFTGKDLDKDPGYQFRLNQGIRGLDMSAAAKGSLLSGNAVQGAVEYGQGFASNEFQNAYNRHLTDYGQEVGDWTRGYNQYNSNYQIKRGEWLDAYNKWYQDKADKYNAFLGLSEMGRGVTNNLAQYGQQNANNQSNALIAAGQARASGIANQANAWGNGFNNIGQAYLLSSLLNNKNNGGNGDNTNRGSYSPSANYPSSSFPIGSLPLNNFYTPSFMNSLYEY